MRLLAAPLAASLMLWASPGSAQAGPSPFGIAPVPDAMLADLHGTGPLRTPFRFSEGIIASLDRQTGELPSILRDVWTQEVAGPLIAANAARAGLLQ